jgi:predicted Zn-dependent protease
VSAWSGLAAIAMLKKLLPLPLALFATTAAALSLVSVRDEIEIGRQAQAQVRAKVPELRDGTVNEYIDALGRQLAARARGPRYPYDFSVANYREINAFALPGGPVWIHRGAIAAATRESQLVGVIAHEIAHIAQRHAAEQLTKATLTNGALGILGAILGDSGGARGARIGAGLFANGLFLKFSRDDEREADRIGADIMARAGWNPRGMLEFMQILREQQGRDPGSVAVFLSTHPSPADRIARLQATVGGHKAGRTNSTRFTQVKARLNRLPRAPAMPRG